MPSRVPDRVTYHKIADTPGLVLGKAVLGSFCFKKHFHLDYHIGLVTDGVEKIGFQGRSERLGKGGISLMPAHEMHDGSGDRHIADSHTLKTFRIEAGLMQSLLQDVSGSLDEVTLRPTMIEAPHWWQHLATLHEQMAGAVPMSMLARDTQFICLIESLLRHSRSARPETIDGKLGRDNWRTVVDFCQANLGEKIALHDLAELCRLSRFQFLRRFAHTVGLTPHAWLLRLRLERSCALLNSGSRSIAQVASEVGFYDQSHFNRAFKQAYSVAPSDY